MGMTVTQRAEFECSYVSAVTNSATELHSHRYRIEFSVCGEQRFIDHGIVIEFAEFASLIKSILPDHKFLFNAHASTESAEYNIASTVHSYLPNAVRSYDAPISAENLCNFLVRDLQQLLNTSAPGVYILNAKLRESANSFAEYSAPTGRAEQLYQAY